MLYSYNPNGAVTTIVPVASEQVGWMVVLAVAAAGAVGWAFTITMVADDIQVVSETLLTNILCEPADMPAKVVDDW